MQASVRVTRRPTLASSGGASCCAREANSAVNLAVHAAGLWSHVPKTCTSFDVSTVQVRLVYGVYGATDFAQTNTMERAFSGFSVLWMPPEPCLPKLIALQHSERYQHGKLHGDQPYSAFTPWWRSYGLQQTVAKTWADVNWLFSKPKIHRWPEGFFLAGQDDAWQQKMVQSARSPRLETDHVAFYDADSEM